MDARLLGVTTVLLWGCVITPDPPPIASATIASNFQAYAIHRVGLVQPRADTLHRSLDRAIRIEFLMASDYQIISVPPSALSGETPLERLRGDYYAMDALRPEVLQGLDALLVPEVIESKTSEPQRLVLRLDLVACETGLTIWSATVSIDGADAAVRHRIEDWQAQLPGGTRDMDPYAVLESSERLARFAVRQLANLL